MSHKLNYLQHREEKVAADLHLIASLLATSRQNGTIGDMGASYSKQPSMKGTSKPASAKSVTSATNRQTAHPSGKLSLPSSDAPCYASGVCVCRIGALFWHVEKLSYTITSHAMHTKGYTEGHVTLIISLHL